MHFSSQYNFDIVSAYFVLTARRGLACGNDVVLSALDRIPYPVYALCHILFALHDPRGQRESLTF